METRTEVVRTAISTLPEVLEESQENGHGVMNQCTHFIVGLLSKHNSEAEHVAYHARQRNRGVEWGDGAHDRGDIG